jgi:ABC-type glycerol-3-phosphate transport system permease component
MSSGTFPEVAYQRHHRTAEARRILGKAFFQIAVTVFAAAFSIPLIWLLMSSLKTNAELIRFPPQFWPEQLIWENYPRVLQQYPFSLWFRNTLFLSANAAIGAVISNSLVAYGFARIRWAGRGVLFALCLGSMLLPGLVTQIPVYITWRKIGLLGTYFPLTLGAWLGSPYFVFLMAQFFRTIPEELTDAARVDGCREFGIFRHIVLPLCKPAMAVVALFAFVGTWGDVMGPLIYLKRTSMYTLAIGLKLMQDTSGLTTPERSDWAGMMVGAALAAIPVVILFFFTQKTFIEGITFTGLKE